MIFIYFVKSLCLGVLGLAVYLQLRQGNNNALSRRCFIDYHLVRSVDMDWTDNKLHEALHVALVVGSDIISQAPQVLKIIDPPRAEFRLEINAVLRNYPNQRFIFYPINDENKFRDLCNKQ